MFAGEEAAFARNSSDTGNVGAVIFVVVVRRRIHKAIGQAVLLDEDRIPLIVRDCAKPSNERKGGRGERHWEKNPLYITRYPPRQWPPRAAPRERIV